MSVALAGRGAGSRAGGDAGRARHGPGRRVPRAARVAPGGGDRGRDRRRGRGDAPGAARARAPERAAARAATGRAASARRWRPTGGCRTARRSPTSAREVSEALRALAGQELRSVSLEAVGPGAFTLSLAAGGRGDHRSPRPAGRAPALGRRVSKAYYMACLDLEGRSVLVVGGGRVALEKVHGLLDCGARVTVVAPEAVPELLALPVEWLERGYHSSDLARSLPRRRRDVLDRRSTGVSSPTPRRAASSATSSTCPSCAR